MAENKMTFFKKPLQEQKTLLFFVDIAEFKSVTFGITDSMLYKTEPYI